MIYFREVDGSVGGRRDVFKVRKLATRSSSRRISECQIGEAHNTLVRETIQYVNAESHNQCKQEM